MSTRDRTRVVSLVLALVALAGCVSDAEPPPAVAALQQIERVLGHGPAGELVVTSIDWTAPSGADGADHLSLAWRDAVGVLRPLTLAVPAIDARVWRGDAVVLGTDARLLRVGAAGVEVLAVDVLGELAVSDDGSALAYVTSQGELGDLHVATYAGDAVVARGLQSAGRVRFTPDGAGLLFVGALRGGVAGVLWAPLDGTSALRSITNGALRSGRPWGEAFVPSPGTAQDFAFDGDVVRWAANGAIVERTWRQL